MTTKTAEEFIKAADVEFDRGDWNGAWKVAVEGLKYHPDHAELKKYAHILAPPKVTSVDRGGHPEVRANREWMKENRARYRGQWVAIKNGQFLASGKNLDEIVEQVGEIKNTDILVTPLY